MSEKANDGSRAGEEKKTSVMEDPSATKQMDALFAVIHNPDSSAGGGGPSAQKASQRSWKDRELPPSFFDASSSSGQRMNSPDKFNFASDPMKPPQKQFHKLGPSINLGPPQMHASHIRSASMPAALGSEMSSHVPLPPGWEASKTPDGLVYYIE